LLTKKIISGASIYGTTDACGDKLTTLIRGFMSCGSGDDHVLTLSDLQQIEKNKDLKPGRLNTSKATLKQLKLRLKLLTDEPVSEERNNGIVNLTRKIDSFK